MLQKGSVRTDDRDSDHFVNLEVSFEERVGNEGGEVSEIRRDEFGGSVSGVVLAGKNVELKFTCSFVLMNNSINI